MMQTRPLFRVAVLIVAIVLFLGMSTWQSSADTPVAADRSTMLTSSQSMTPAAAPAYVADDEYKVYLPAIQSSVVPFLGAPACPESVHDKTVYHGLWDSKNGCHYDHTHNDNPFVLNGVFGPVGQTYSGQTVSYPWQTPDENVYKHEGYKWYTVSLNNCTVNEPDDNCIKAFRLQYHVMGVLGAGFRTHSFSLEALVCNEGGNNCGTIRTGGWSDFGILCIPYKGEHVPLPSMDPPNPPTLPNGEVNCDVPPYRGHESEQHALEKGKGVDYTWNSADLYGYNKIVEYDFQSRDDLGGVNVNQSDDPVLICPDFSCNSNHSTMLVYEVIVKVAEALDDDNDGFVTYNGYTDRYGNVIDECTPLGADCVPLEIKDVPVGVASFRVPLRPETPHKEFDIYFCGNAQCKPGDVGATPSGWITYPN